MCIIDFQCRLISRDGNMQEATIQALISREKNQRSFPSNFRVFQPALAQVPRTLSRVTTLPQRQTLDMCANLTALCSDVKH
jgi:hypothetical protein